MNGGLGEQGNEGSWTPPSPANELAAVPDTTEICKSVLTKRMPGRPTDMARGFVSVRSISSVFYRDQVHDMSVRKPAGSFFILQLHDRSTAGTYRGCNVPFSLTAVHSCASSGVSQLNGGNSNDTFDAHRKQLLLVAESCIQVVGWCRQPSR